MHFIHTPNAMRGHVSYYDTRLPFPFFFLLKKTIEKGWKKKIFQ